MILSYIDLAITILFIIEMFMKIIARGFLFCGKNSYFRIAWNWLDCIVVLTSFFSIIYQDSTQLRVFKLLRMLRLLRPLRVINGNEGLRLAVATLIHVVPNVFNILIVSMIFYTIFAIFCVSFKKGTLFSCYEYMDGIDLSTKWDCLNAGGAWLN